MDVVLKNLGQHASGLGAAFQKWFGVKPYAKGDDLVIRSRDAKRAFADRPTLRLHPRLSLSAGSERDHAAIMIAQIPASIEQYRPPAPDELLIQSGFGHLSEMQEILALVTVEPTKNLEDILAERLIPAMLEMFDARYVTGVSVDAEYQQACVSFMKVALLSEKYGADKASQLVRERGALATALPYGMAVASYVDVLTRLSPILFTLPVDRVGCTWHFQKESAYWFSKAPAHGVVQQFMANLSPLADSSEYFGLAGLGKPDGMWIFHLLRFVTEGINRLMGFLNDPRNFLDLDSTANLLKQIQAHSTVQLIFADVNALNYSTNAHNRISYAMSALDKLANLRAKLGKAHVRPPEDKEAMQKFYTVSQRDQLKGLIRDAAAKFGYEDIAESFVSMIDQCYQEIHDQLARQCRDANSTEEERLQRIWMQRNVRHGMFLKKQQFERLFLETDGTIGAAIATLPFLLLFGLISNPKEFLSFEPDITT